MLIQRRRNAMQSAFVKIPLFLLSLITVCELQSNAIPIWLPVSRRNADQNSAVPPHRTFQDTRTLFARRDRQEPRRGKRASCNKRLPATWGKEYEIVPGIGAQSGAAF